jgi:rhodanese-related sulfurtransferase
MAKALHDFVNDALTRVTEVTPEETAQFLKVPNVMILDVREPDEFSQGHLPGAVNIPRGFLEVKADLIHPKKDSRLADRTVPIIAYCGGGHRSALAADTLQQMGFESVKSMRGGWTAWTSAQLPIEKSGQE